MTDIKKPIAVLVILLALCVAAYFIFPGVPLPSAVIHGASDANTGAPPSPSAEVLAMLAKSKGFQALVSYTERGFEPALVSLKKGDAIRFINNSDEDVWVAATGASGAVYPGAGNECGQSAFDSCVILKKGEFWEFTFSASGTWGYQNNRNVERTGTVKVI